MILGTDTIILGNDPIILGNDQPFFRGTLLVLERPPPSIRVDSSGVIREWDVDLESPSDPNQK